MKIYALVLTIFMTVNSLCANKPAKEDVLSNPVVARSLADACEIVRLINELKWESVKLKLNKADKTGLMILKPQSKVKDWHGVGAYRGSEFDVKAQSIKHRFSYGGGRKAFHEVWITYAYTKEGYNKPSVQVLGW